MLLEGLVAAVVITSVAPVVPTPASLWTAQDETNYIVRYVENKPEPISLPVVHRHVTANVEQWRSLVEKYFRPGDVSTAMRIMQCESGGNPDAKNPHSSASGLFQHLARYWPERSAKAGWGGASIWDPEANVAVAAWLKAVAGWRSWACY